MTKKDHYHKSLELFLAFAVKKKAQKIWRIQNLVVTLQQISKHNVANRFKILVVTAVNLKNGGSSFAYVSYTL